jgi:DedD protein
MDSRAKQRLTGAVILVALFVLLVPELLTGPRSSSEPAAEQGDEGLRRYTIDLDAPASTAPMAPAKEPAVSLPAVADPMNDAQARVAPGAAATPAPAPESTLPPVATNAAPVASSTVPAPDKVVAAAPPKPAAATAMPAPAAPRPVAAQAERGTFVVQLGSFRDRDNADRLVRDMTAKGFACFVAPIKSGGRELYRVRVGPTRDRASAEALAAQLRRIGQSGSIVPIS